MSARADSQLSVKSSFNNVTLVTDDSIRSAGYPTKITTITVVAGLTRIRSHRRRDYTGGDERFWQSRRVALDRAGAGCGGSFAWLDSTSRTADTIRPSRRRSPSRRHELTIYRSLRVHLEVRAVAHPKRVQRRGTMACWRFRYSPGDLPVARLNNTHIYSTCSKPVSSAIFLSG